jgi:hypothetical protein
VRFVRGSTQTEGRSAVNRHPQAAENVLGCRPLRPYLLPFISGINASILSKRNFNILQGFSHVPSYTKPGLRPRKRTRRKRFSCSYNLTFEPLTNFLRVSSSSTVFVRLIYFQSVSPQGGPASHSPHTTSSHLLLPRPPLLSKLPPADL